MSITFILFGVIIIYYLFNAKWLQLDFRALSFFVIAVLIELGYFIGNIFLTNISLNMMHLFAFALMLFLLSRVGNLSLLCLIFMPILLEVVILSVDRGYTLFYSGTLYFICVFYFIFLFLIGIKNCTSLLSVFSLIYLLIDSIFQFNDLQYIYLNLDYIFLALLSLYVFEIIFDYFRVTSSFWGGYVCQKIK